MKAQTVSKRVMRTTINSIDPGKGKRTFPGGFQDKLDKREAMLILGLKGAFNAKVLKARHMKMIIKNHPDKGKNYFLKNRRLSVPGRENKQV